MCFDKVKLINSYFSSADKNSILDLKNKVLFSERQNIIFDLYYVQKKDCGYIADMLCVCPGVITKELHKMREKMFKFI